MKDTLDKVMDTFKLVEISLVDLLKALELDQDEAGHAAKYIVNQDGASKLRGILDMPQGQSLPPKELAEMLLSQHLLSSNGEINGEIAASMNLIIN